MPPTYPSQRGKDSPYASSFICGFFSLFVLLFSMMSWSHKAELNDKLAARTDAEDALWVPAKARLLRDKTSPSYAQPEERVRLEYDCAERENYSISTIEIPLYRVARHLEVEQETITEEALVPLFYQSSQPIKWSIDYLTKPMLQERLESATKRAHVSLTLALLLIALTVQLTLRTQKKLKVAELAPKEEKAEEDELSVHSSSKKKNGKIMFILPLALFAFSGIWLGVLCYGFWPQVIETMPAAHFPTVTGKVLDMRGHTSSRARGGSSFTIDHTAVQFEWQGKSYITREQGFGFGRDEYNSARKAGSCTVYVNEAQPELSLLVGGVPVWLIAIFAVFTFVGALPAAFGVYTIVILIRGKSIPFKSVS